MFEPFFQQDPNERYSMFMKNSGGITDYMQKEVNLIYAPHQVNICNPVYATILDSFGSCSTKKFFG